MACRRCRAGGSVECAVEAVYAVQSLTTSVLRLWRHAGMEDAHATILNLDDKKGEEKASFFAVYDGHGGTSRGGDGNSFMRPESLT